MDRRQGDDRHRQVLCGLEPVQTRGRVDTARIAARRPHADDRVLPEASRALSGRAGPHPLQRGMSGARIPFMDLRLAEESADVRAAITRVVDSGWYVLGPDVEAFEQEFAAACGATHAAGTGNGTDALAIILRAPGIGPGDEVITSPLSAASTALAIVMARAQPVLAGPHGARPP